MDRSAAKKMHTEELLFHDGFGDRLLIHDSYGHPLESLVLRAELSSVPSFDFALNQRVTQLEKFEHASFIPVRHLIRTPGPVPRLSVNSEYAAGVRLSDVLTSCESRDKPLSTGAALFLIREILDAVTVLHRQTGDVSHGALSPERILIVDGKIRVTDYVLGSAIEQLRFSSERYWKELRVTVPPSAGGSRFDRRVDLAQVGMIAVGLLAGRPLRDTEHIGGLSEVMMGLTEQGSGGRKSLSLPLRGWLMKALHMDLRRTFVTAVEAEHALEEAMSECGVRPTAAELDLIGVRPPRVESITVKTAAAPKPAAVAQAPVVAEKPALKKDAWEGRDVSQGTMYDPNTDPGTQLRRGRIVASATKARGVKTLFQIGIFGVLLAVTFTVAQYIPPPAKLFSSTGTLVIETKPDGVQLLVDGKPQGVTPLTLKLKAGRHEVELRGSGKPRVFNVFVTKGDRVSQYIEFPTNRVRK